MAVCWLPFLNKPSTIAPSDTLAGGDRVACLPRLQSPSPRSRTETFAQGGPPGDRGGRPHHGAHCLAPRPRAAANTHQYGTIAAKVAALSRQVDASRAAAAGAAAKNPSSATRTGPLGAIGLVLWKFKFVLAFLLTKGKLLLLRLTKASTPFSMLLSLGV